MPLEGGFQTRQPQPGQPKTKIEPKEAPKPKALLADDNESFRKMTLTALLMAGFEVIAVENGEQLLSALRAPGMNFELVVTDVRMPKKNGVQALQEMRAEEGLKDIPVLVVSAGAEPEIIEAIKASGASYMAKPYDLNSFKATVVSLVNKEKKP